MVNGRFARCKIAFSSRMCHLSGDRKGIQAQRNVNVASSMMNTSCVHFHYIPFCLHTMQILVMLCVELGFQTGPVRDPMFPMKCRRDFSKQEARMFDELDQ